MKGHLNTTVRFIAVQWVPCRFPEVGDIKKFQIMILDHNIMSCVDLHRQHGRLTRADRIRETGMCRFDTAGYVSNCYTVDHSSSPTYWIEHSMEDNENNYINLHQ